MPRKNAPEFSYDPKTKLYRKQIKNGTTGKWVPVYGKTKAELREKVEARKEEFKRQAAVEETPYVYEYAAKWYRLHTSGLGQKRKDDYRNAINNHICPVIGGKLIKEVSYDDIKAVMAEAAGLSSSSQQKIVVTLKRIFSAAERNGLISRSPCSDLKAGGEAAAEKIPLTKEQQCRLVDAVKDTKAYAFIMLCLYAGLRREEALGLQWDCVTLDGTAPHISVRRVVRWDGQNAAIISDKLKSDAAQRNIPIPSQLVDCLKQEKIESKGDYVVANSKGEAMTFASFRRMWDVIRVRSCRTIKTIKDGQEVLTELKLGDKVRNHPIVISLDFHVTPHQLRHTYITELILAGTPIKAVQYLAGHATVALTLNIYTHLMENKPEDTIQYITNTFEAKTQAKNDSEPQSD